VQYNVRYGLKEAERHGVMLFASKPVFLLKAAANRDPRAFTDADRFDIDRDRGEPQNPVFQLRRSQLPGGRAGSVGWRARYEVR
jgi:cytochrome P450